MKQQAELHTSVRHFEVEYYVYVQLHPYMQQLVLIPSNHIKLHAPKYYDLYKVLDKHDSVPYKLELHTSSYVHPIFHVSQLQKYVGSVLTTTQLPKIHCETSDKKP